MNAKVKITAISAVSVLAGYTLGAIFGLPSTSGNLSSGDISKVSKYNKQTVASYSAYEEKLLSDKQAMEDENISTGVLAQKLVEFSELVDQSVNVAGNIDELSEQVNALKDLQMLSGNVANTAKIAVDALDNLAKGNNNSGISYEQASQNLMVAYTMVDNQSRIGKDFALAADEYYAKHGELTDLAEVRDRWAQFCCECSLIKGYGDSEQQYWASCTNAKVSNLTSVKVLSKNNDLVRKVSVTEIERFSDPSTKVSHTMDNIRHNDVVRSREDVVRRDENMVRGREDIVRRDENMVRGREDVVRNNENMVRNRAAVVRHNENMARSREDAVKRNEESIRKNANESVRRSDPSKVDNPRREKKF